MERREANKAGLKRYRTGRPCKYGHYAERETRSGRCIECKNACQRDYGAANRERYKEYGRKYREANKDYFSEYNREWHQANRKKVLERYKSYYKRNMAANAARSANYAAAKLRRTPAWLSTDERNQIKVFYDVACRISNCLGESFHVDHIHPLRGELVSGLHVPWNLQVIAGRENIAKGNRFHGD